MRGIEARLLRVARVYTSDSRGPRCAKIVIDWRAAGLCHLRLKYLFSVYLPAALLFLGCSALHRQLIHDEACYITTRYASASLERVQSWLNASKELSASSEAQSFLRLPHPRSVLCISCYIVELKHAQDPTTAPCSYLTRLTNHLCLT